MHKVEEAAVVALESELAAVKMRAEMLTSELATAEHKLDYALDRAEVAEIEARALREALEQIRHMPADGIGGRSTAERIEAICTRLPAPAPTEVATLWKEKLLLQDALETLLDLSQQSAYNAQLHVAQTRGWDVLRSTGWPAKENKQ